MALKDDYKPGDRFLDDMAPTFPDRKTIPCRDCAFRKPGICGEINAICRMFGPPEGKPNEILFQNAPCQFYTKATD